MSRRAFTLVELLVVIAIVGLLSTVAVVATNNARINARNTQRKANLVQVSKALDLYYADNGAYPSTGGSGNWHGACSHYGSYADTGAGAWIPGLSPNYMAALPHDPNTEKPGGTNCPVNQTYACYLYTSNGTDYKLLAHCTPEGSGVASDPMIDPGGRTFAYSVYSPGAVAW
jgi:prepilin-type N-terminal cleavage/methylation domain-containing protein